MDSFASGRHGSRPTPAEWRAFAGQLLQAGGLGSLGAGLIFFVAANWSAWGLVGRFGLLQAGLVLCVGLALWRPPPSRPGRAALLLATLFTGALLALFGQSYQTGSDVHELFFTWALIALPFAVAALSGAVWAVWWVVLNVGLALLCGGLPLDHFVWRLIDGWAHDRAVLLMLPCAVNLLGAGLFFALRRTRHTALAPLWLPRALLGIGLAYGASASLPQMGHHGAPIVAVYALISVVIAGMSLTRYRDLFPLTVLAGCWITVSTAWLADSMRLNDMGEFLLIALWLIGSSAVAGTRLMGLLRQWRGQAGEGASS